MFVDTHDIPDPVCACCRLWSEDPITAATYEVRVGDDQRQLYWSSMKPFNDANVYIVGDTFNAYVGQVSFNGWSENCLLTSERMLFRYFNLTPLVEDLPLEPEVDDCN